MNNRVHSIAIKRGRSVWAFLSDQSLGTDARNGMSSIPGVEHLEIVSESDELVRLTYEWSGVGMFWETDEYLERFGVCRADWPEITR